MIGCVLFSKTKLHISFQIEAYTTSKQYNSTNGWGNEWCFREMVRFCFVVDYSYLFLFWKITIMLVQTSTSLLLEEEKKDEEEEKKEERGEEKKEEGGEETEKEK